VCLGFAGNAGVETQIQLQMVTKKKIYALFQGPARATFARVDFRLQIVPRETDETERDSRRSVKEKPKSCTGPRMCHLSHRFDSHRSKQE